MSTVIVSCSPVELPLVGFTVTHPQLSAILYVKEPVPLFQISKVVESVSPAYLSPKLLESSDTQNYITYLAVERQVSASTQNQALNALLFFYTHVLKKDYGDFKGIPRAKKTKYVPTILSRKEIDAIIENLDYPISLVVKILYGSGLRLTEGLNLRVQDFDFDEEVITIYGKGRKFRKVFLSKKIIPELKEHLERVRNLHRHDLNKGYDGVFMPGLLENKHKNSAKEFGWQFFF